MDTSECSNNSACNTRRLARPFLPDIPHHPSLDPDFQDEDAELVPKDLAPRGRLNWELPRPAKTNLHIMLELTEETDNLLEEYRSKLPAVEQVVEEWVEMRGASPTTTGEVKLREMASQKKFWNVQDEGEQTDSSAEPDYIFNMTRSLDSPGRADVIYLADAVEQKKIKGRRSSIPENIRAVDWLDFDGSYVHVAEASHQAEPETPISESAPVLRVPGSGRRTNSRPPNLRVSDWSESEPVEYLSTNIYSLESVSSRDSKNAGGEADKGLGPFEGFWRTHGDANGYHIKMDDELLVHNTSGHLPDPDADSLESMDHQFLQKRAGTVFDHETRARLKEATPRFKVSS